jgi:hypothetical protein
MAAVISSYVPNIYHQHLNSLFTLFYGTQYISNNNHKTKRQNQRLRSRTTTPSKAVEHVDNRVKQLPVRRQPRIHRQVILLPTPEPIYRQVRHRLPTPERQVIHRTFYQKANGDVVVEQERHRKKARSQSRPQTAIQAQSPRIRQVNTT